MNPINGRKFLVTGGSGFIGAALVQRLVAMEGRVRVFDSHLRGDPRRLQAVCHQIELEEGDVRDSTAVMRAAKGCDSIIHLAYLNGTEFFYSKPDLVLEIGVKGIIHTLDAAIAHKIKDFVLASSSEVYQTPPVFPTPETVPLVVPDVHNPRFSYGGGKIISELLCVNYGRKLFDRMTIFRPHNVYGPDMGSEHVIPQFILRAQKIEQEFSGMEVPFPIQGDGSETRSFIHINDFTDGLIRVIESGGHNEIYHIGTEEEVPVREVARMILSFFDRRPVFQNVPSAEGGPLRRCPDITKLKQLGFSPKIPLKTGLEEVCRWYVQNAGLYTSRNQL